MIQDAIAMLVAEEELSEEKTREVAREILEGEATPAQIAAFITAMRIRGEQVEHIKAFAQVLREKAHPFDGPDGVVLDVVGTGGDAVGTFNVSTTAAFIAAGAGVCVAKHGNRAVSSRCGSADVLAQLGVDITVGPDVVQRAMREVGIAFFFAPVWHSAMKHAAVPRREVGIRSIFNMVGPLSNPAHATHQLIGVYSPELTETFARVLREIGVERALVVHGSDGLDEVTVTTVTQVTELRDGEIDTWTLAPRDFGVKPADVSDLLVESVEEAAERMHAILSGAKGPCSDMALMNAGAALYVADKVASIQDGYHMAVEAVAEGKALEKLEALIAVTKQ